MKPNSVATFNIEFLSTDPPTDDRIAQLRKWCVSFNESGLTPISDITGFALGNLSFRLEPDNPAFIITASGLSSKDSLAPSDFVEVSGSDIERRTVSASGARDPSSESMMHFDIYKRRPDVGAIFHGHDEDILARGPELGIPLTAEEQPSGSIELLRQAIDILGQESFLLLKNHGFLSLGGDMQEAGELAFRVKQEIGEGRDGQG